MKTLNEKVVNLHREFITAGIPSTQHPRNTVSYDFIVDEIVSADSTSFEGDYDAEGRTSEEWLTAIKKCGGRPPTIETLNHVLRNKNMTCIQNRWYDKNGIRALIAKILRTNAKRLTVTIDDNVSQTITEEMALGCNDDNLIKFMGWNKPLPTVKTTITKI